jgi:mRNA-degrading endonuclease toxin of MazEF toxin-antitoxin module
LVQLIDFGLQSLSFLVSGSAALKERGQTGDGSLLPFCDQIRVDLMLGGKLCDRLRLAWHFKDDLCLQCRRILFSGSFHLAIHLRIARFAVLVYGTIIIVPCTRWQERYTHWAWIARLEANSQNGLGKDSAADAFHIRAVALERFGQLRGTLSADEWEAVINAVVATVDS